MDDLMTMKEAATVLKIGKAAIIAWAKKGNFPAVKVGKAWRVREADMLEWYNGKKVWRG